MLILTPTFGNHGSGAAVYYRLLTKLLSTRVPNITIVSERDDQQSPYDYHGIFPPRSSRDRQLFTDVLRYAVQNLAYFRLPGIVRRADPSTLLVHSSFYYLPGSFPRIMRGILRESRGKRKVIADVRDTLLPERQAQRIAAYDYVIACSRNVESHLRRCGIPEEKIRFIPVMQEPLRVDENRARELRRELGIEGRRYLFFAGLIKEQKAVDLLLESFEYVRPVMPDLILVLSGLLKTTQGRILQGLNADGVSYLGNRSRDEVTHLMAGAALCINLSPSEGMPRSSLEALALKRPVILPPKVPEFERYCSAFVARSRSPREIARLIIDTLERERLAEYPTWQHLPEHVLPKYLALLGEV